MSIVEMVYGILFDPAKTLNYLGREKPLLRGLFIFCLILAYILIINRAIAISAGNISNLFNNGSIWVLSAFAIVFTYIILAVLAGLFSLLSEIFYRKGNASGLLVCLSFAVIPGVFGPPLQYTALLLGIGEIGVLFSMLSVLWVLVLQVLSLREALQVHTGQAILLFTLPGLLVIAFITILVFILASTIPF